MVLITAKVDTYQEYLQMLGRGSRTRGICEGILYVTSKDKASVVMDKMKKQNFDSMAELTHLMKLLESKSKDKLEVTKLEIKQEEDKMIRSLTELEREMTRQQYAKLIQGIELK